MKKRILLLFSHSRYIVNLNIKSEVNNYIVQTNRFFPARYDSLRLSKKAKAMIVDFQSNMNKFFLIIFSFTFVFTKIKGFSICNCDGSENVIYKVNSHRLKLLPSSSISFNRPFYRFGGHIEFIRFKEYYGMPRGA